jgi:hypothetical protein
MSDISPHTDAPDLSLRGVAFARLSEGRVVARGTFESVGYVRPGSRLTALKGTASLEPEPGSAFASWGTVRVVAPSATGELSAQRFTATGGVRMNAARGDSAVTERVDYDGAAGSIRGDQPIDAQGPGYRVHGNGLLARTDGSSIALTGGVTGNLVMEARQ